MRNFEAKISVIIAVYNVEAYLEKCLRSMIDQTYQNLEIICVDDGSQDNSGHICDVFAKVDERIRVIHKLNGGVSSARNVGLKYCTGDYISFIDGDDWLEPNMYEVLSGKMTSPDIDISACGYYEDSDGICKPVENRLPVPEGPSGIREFLKYIYIRDQYRGVASYLWNKIIRSEVILRNKLVFSDLSVSEDVLFAAQCYIHSDVIVYTNLPLYHYVQRPDSAMHDIQKKLHVLGSCKAYQMIIDLYEAEGIDPTVVDYVKRFYVYHSYKLLKLAVDCGIPDKIYELKANINKYFDTYCKTNSDYPERIEEVRRLVERTAEIEK